MIVAGDVDCVAHAIYAEARGEGVQGMLLIGNVIRNRMTTFKKTACQVVLQTGQFAKYNNKQQISNYYRMIANVALSPFIPDLTKGALYFTNRSVIFKDKKIVYTYKNHLFYVDRPISSVL